jgi:AcrR family transcriptional regulator
MCHKMATPARNARPSTRPKAPPRTRRPRGLKTRRAILGKAVALASIEGLEALTIGRLASNLRMSKSGLFAHFGSKEELQHSAVDAASEIFVQEVIRPCSGLRGLRRLRALCQYWFRHTELSAFPGGCFFTAASLEFDDRPGRVHDRIVVLMERWLHHLETTVIEAQASGEVASAVDPHEVAFEIHALAMGANWRARLFKDHAAFSLARRAISARIDQIAAGEKRRR